MVVNEITEIKKKLRLDSTESYGEWQFISPDE